MQFEVLQEDLFKSLSLVTKVVASRPQLPVLANVLLEVKTEGLVLSATDLELGMVLKVPAKVENMGVVSVPARIFLDFIGSLKPGKINFKLEKESLKVESGGYRGSIQTISAEEFPSLPEVGQKIVGEVESEVFGVSVSSVLYAVAKDALRPVLTGILIDFNGKGKMKLVATDGFRLAVRKVGVVGSGWESPILIPARAVNEVVKLANALGGVKIGIAVHPDTNRVVFQMGDNLVVSQLLSGNFPEYQKIIPTEHNGEVEMEREELLSALKIAHIFARENSNVVQWNITNGELILLANTPEKGEARAEVGIRLQGDGTSIAFNAKFVLDFLTSSKAERVSLSFTDAMSPGVFKEVGENNYIYVVMPVNV